MSFFNRTALASIAALAIFLPLAGEASAQDPYPSRPITLIVPFPAGGVTDLVARELAHRLGSALGQAVVVDNRAGAGGNIGTQVVSRAEPDGYTLGVLTVSALSIGPHLGRKLPFNPSRDFTPITNLVNTPGALIAAPTTPYKSFGELVQHAKAHPGKVTYASVGPGSIPHLTAEILSKAVKVDMVHVPYRGQRRQCRTCSLVTSICRSRPLLPRR